MVLFLGLGLKEFEGFSSGDYSISSEGCVDYFVVVVFII